MLRVPKAEHYVGVKALDSIDAIDMIVKLQELIGQRIEETALRKVRTIRDVVDLVHAHHQ